MIYTRDIKVLEITDTISGFTGGILRNNISNKILSFFLITPSEKSCHFCHQVMNVIKALCSMNACRYELEQITGGGFQSRRPPRTEFQHSSYNSPPKLMRGDNFRGSFSGNSSGNYSGYRGGYNNNNNNNRGYGKSGGYGRGGYRGNSGGGFYGRY